MSRGAHYGALAFGAEEDAMFPSERDPRILLDVVVFLQQVADICLNRVSRLQTPTENAKQLYPPHALAACKVLLVERFQRDFLAPPQSSSGTGRKGGKELGRVLRTVYANREIRAKTASTTADGYEYTILRFVDHTKADVRTQVIYSRTEEDELGRLYTIYLCTDGFVYWHSGYQCPELSIAQAS
jgi:hypothetical protein